MINTTAPRRSNLFSIFMQVIRLTFDFGAVDGLIVVSLAR